MALTHELRPDLNPAQRGVFVGWFADQGQRIPARIDPATIPESWRTFLRPIDGPHVPPDAGEQLALI